MSAFTTVRISKTKTVGKKIGEKFNLSCLFMNIFRIQNRCFLRFWSWRCRRFRTKWRNKFACSKISPRCPPCCLLWFSREHNARVHLTFPLNEMYSYSRLCDRLRSSAIIWKQLSSRSSAIVCDHMETSLKKYSGEFFFVSAWGSWATHSIFVCSRPTRLVET